jgi:hypothetical protein
MIRFVFGILIASHLLATQGAACAQSPISAESLAGTYYQKGSLRSNVNVSLMKTGEYTVFTWYCAGGETVIGEGRWSLNRNIIRFTPSKKVSADPLRLNRARVIKKAQTYALLADLDASASQSAKPDQLTELIKWVEPSARLHARTLPSLPGPPTDYFGRLDTYFGLPVQ